MTMNKFCGFKFIAPEKKKIKQTILFRLHWTGDWKTKEKSDVNWMNSDINRKFKSLTFSQFFLFSTYDVKFSRRVSHFVHKSYSWNLHFSFSICSLMTLAMKTFNPLVSYVSKVLSPSLMDHEQKSQVF